MPRIIRKRSLVIRGFSGDGGDTAGLWERFTRAFGTRPFAQDDENGYEIRVYSDDGCLCHVGYTVNDAVIDDAKNVGTVEPFCDFVLPESCYASFDVIVSNGYDSENANMNEWLASNPGGWKQSELDGKSYVVECYNSRFESEGIVMIWIPVHK